MRIPLNLALITIALSTLIMILIRGLPFVLLQGKNPPMIIKFIDKFIPPMIMIILVVYCFKDVNFSSPQDSIPFCACSVLVAVLHLTTKNSLISTTVMYIILTHIGRL